MSKQDAINALCARCQNTCKQPATVKLVRCPMFEPKMSDEDFEKLLNEMDDVGRKADELRTRVSRLIEDMREDMPEPETEDDIESDEH